MTLLCLRLRTQLVTRVVLVVGTTIIRRNKNHKHQKREAMMMRGNQNPKHHNTTHSSDRERRSYLVCVPVTIVSRQGNFRTWTSSEEKQTRMIHGNDYRVTNTNGSVACQRGPGSALAGQGHIKNILRLATYPKSEERAIGKWPIYRAQHTFGGPHPPRSHKINHSIQTGRQPSNREKKATRTTTRRQCVIPIKQEETHRCCMS